MEASEELKYPHIMRQNLSQALRKTVRAANALGVDSNAARRA